MPRYMGTPVHPVIVEAPPSAALPSILSFATVTPAASSTRRIGAAGSDVPGRVVFAMTTDGQSAFGAFYRRKRAQLGPMQALVATAHKTCPERSRRIAWTVYYMLMHQVQYVDIGAEAYERKQPEREMAYLKKKAAKLGFDLSPHNPTAAMAQAVAMV